jgi:HlyD family secretion protein
LPAPPTSWPRRYALPFLAVVVLAAVALGLWKAFGGGSGAPEFRLAKVERGSVTSVVSASGTLNAVTTVLVGSQISGQIKELLVDFNSAVKKGQLLARIDPETYEIRVRQAEADLEAARTVNGLTQKKPACRSVPMTSTRRSSPSAARPRRSTLPRRR